MARYKYKLKDGVDFNLVNEKSIKKFGFDLSYYYDDKTRLFKVPESYVAYHLMGQVFIDYLLPLELVEEVE